MSKLRKVTGYKRFLHYAACFGASVVIIGALFKIMHWPGASIMLIAGLGTEALIFTLYGFDVPHEEVDWTLVYPELAGIGTHEEGEEAGSDLPVTQQLDNMLEQAKIGPELIESLGAGMKNLAETANKLSDITNAQEATNEYVRSVKNASDSVSSLAETYQRAARSVEDLANTNGVGQSIGENLNSVAKNLAALNATYELQLQGSRQHLEATNKFYDSLAELMKNLHDSVEDTRKYRTEMANLSNNLSALNTIYGNMLSAMNYKG
ncbi:MAG: gliding motility protein GldL [Bacteroidia bacterium]|nr:gliding motility protein GldL [Bacteroidia bacterium]